MNSQIHTPTTTAVLVRCGRRWRRQTSSAPLSCDRQRPLIGALVSIGRVESGERECPALTGNYYYIVSRSAVVVRLETHSSGLQRDERQSQLSIYAYPPV